MNCPSCGEICHCHSEPPPLALPRGKPDARDVAVPVFPLVPARRPASERQLIDVEAPDLSEQEFAASLESSAGDAPLDSVCAQAFLPAHQTACASSDAASGVANPSEEALDGNADLSWRNEISARLNRYRSRRRIRPPRYPSLNLNFDAAEPSGSHGTDASPPAFEPVSDRALALDGMMAKPAPAADTNERVPQELSADVAPQAASSPSGYSGAKILEFPRPAWSPPVAPADQLAEPVVARPRILEVPEVAPEPPALGGITIDASERREPGKQPGIDIPLDNASLARRMLASGIDGLIVASASALFGIIFWKVAAVRPPLVQLVGLGASIPCLFWAAYQYLLIVYAACTPGLRAAGLELVRFDGTSTRRSLRRWRVLASYLSGASLGMGFAWAFLDENALCWHDRITRTYLTPRRQPVGDGMSRRVE